MNYDVEKAKREVSELQQAFREIFPLAGDFDLPRAPCHIKQFLRDRIEQETSERCFHQISQISRVLCEVTLPKTHMVDMARIVVDEVKNARRMAKELQALKDVQKDRRALLDCVRSIGRVCGCNHTEDADGWARLTQCVQDLLRPEKPKGDAEPASAASYKVLGDAADHGVHPHGDPPLELHGVAADFLDDGQSTNQESP